MLGIETKVLERPPCGVDQAVVTFPASPQPRSLPDHVDRWTDLAGGSLADAAIPRPRTVDPSPVERLVRRDATGVWRTAGMTLVLAALLGFVTYTVSRGSGKLDWADLGRWLSRAQDGWDPMATLAVIAGIVLPLFLATQVGDATGARGSATHSARAVGLETVTSAACLCGAVLSWMTAPAVFVGDGAAPVNMLVSLAAPVLFSALFAVSAPSEVSDHLARARSEALLVEIRRLAGEFDAALRGPDGTPGRDRWRRGLLKPLARDGVVHGVLIGAVLAAVTWHGPERFIVDTAATAIVFAGAYVGAIAFRIDGTVTAMLDGRLTVMALRWLRFCAWLFLVAVTLLVLVAGHWRVAMIIGVATIGAALLARARFRTRAFQALVYLSFRSRAVAYVRAARRRESEPVEDEPASS